MLNSPAKSQDDTARKWPRLDFKLCMPEPQFFAFPLPPPYLSDQTCEWLPHTESQLLRGGPAASKAAISSFSHRNLPLEIVAWLQPQLHGGTEEGGVRTRQRECPLQETTTVRPTPRRNRSEVNFSYNIKASVVYSAFFLLT